MPTGNIYLLRLPQEMVDNEPIFEGCIEGFHVTVHWRGPMQYERKVIFCDHTCEDREILYEFPCHVEWVEELELQCGESEFFAKPLIQCACTACSS